MRSLTLTLLLLAALTTMPGCGGSEARKDKALERGQEFLAERDYAKARIEFRNALQIDPTDASARTLLGESAEALGNFEEAVNAYRAALDLDPGQIRARARLGRMMVFGGVPEQALELVAPGLEQNPRSADLLGVRATARLQQGDVEAARQDAVAALAVQAGHSDATALLATLLWREDKRDEALALLDRTLEASPDDAVLRQIYAQLLLTAGKPEQAAAQLKEVVRLEPENQAHRYRLAQLYASQKMTDAAIETLRDAVKAKPGDVDAKLALANLLAAQRSFEDAERELLAFVKAAPKDLDLRLGVGRFYEANGRLEPAELAYREVVEAAGDRASGLTARTRIASLMIRGGQLDEATALLEDVLARNPSDADALVMRAQIAIQRGDTDAAVVDLRAALRDQPTNVLLIAQLAQAYIRSGNLTLAEQTLRQAVQANPRDAMTRLALAQFLVNKGEPDKARPVLEQLVKDDPNNLEALEGLARLLLLAGDPAAALQAATTLQALQPKSMTGYLLAGAAQQALGRGDDARSSYEAGLAASPEALEPLVALSQMDVAAGGSARALARIDARLAEQPKDAALHNLRGDLLLAMKRPADALASFEAAIKGQPSWPQPHRGQAAALVASGQAERAIETLKGALDATGESADIALELAGLYSLQARHDDAIAVYERMLAKNADDAVAANNLAMLLVTHRSDEASLERAGQLAERFAASDNPAFLDTYGWVLYKRGRYAEAIVPLEKAVAKVPESQELSYHLGMAQLRAGRSADARKTLEVAVAGQQKYPGREEAQSALEGLAGK